MCERWMAQHSKYLSPEMPLDGKKPPGWRRLRRLSCLYGALACHHKGAQWPSWRGMSEEDYGQWRCLTMPHRTSGHLD